MIVQGEGDTQDAREESALIRRWLKAAEEMLKRDGAKKGGERAGTTPPPPDVDPGRPSKR